MKVKVENSHSFINKIFQKFFVLILLIHTGPVFSQGEIKEEPIEDTQIEESKKESNNETRENDSFSKFILLNPVDKFFGIKRVPTPLSLENITTLKMTLENPMDTSPRQIEGNTLFSLSGDVVGNGMVGPHSIFESKSGFNGFINKHERAKRNQLFNSYLENKGINIEMLRSGDVVGNGGGLYEAQAYFVYQNLDKMVTDTLEQESISLNNDERKILKEIGLVLQGTKKRGKLIFLNSKDFPNFFYDEKTDQAERLAKTGFGPQYPIFLNRDQIEKEFETDDLLWVSILIHELGHQAGVINHDTLDRIGAKVALVAGENREQLFYEIDKDNIIGITVDNHPVFNGVADIHITYNGYSHVLNVLNEDDHKEVCDNFTFGGLKINNLHWQSSLTLNEDGTYVKGKAGGWAEITCYNLEQSLYFSKKRDVDINLKIFKNDITGVLEYR